MIKPVNGHILIGTIIDAAEDVVSGIYRTNKNLNLIGNKAYFDAWLAAKYPKKDGKDGEFYWLVKWEDIRALDEDLYVEPK